MIPFIVIGPILNLAVFVYLGFWIGWTSAGYILGLLVIVFALQHYSSKLAYVIKAKEGAFNDRRMKLIGDAVSGIRTIKCFGWENQFLKQIMESRFGQAVRIFWMSVVSTLGMSVFQSSGLLIILAVFIPKWKDGEYLEEGDSFALLSVIYILSFSSNSITYYGMVYLQTLLAIAKRLGTVFALHEKINN